MSSTQVNLTNEGKGGYVLVEARTVSASSSVSFTGLTRGPWYSIKYSFTQGTSSGATVLRFNSSSSSVYRWACEGRNSNNAVTSNYGQDLTGVGLFPLNQLNGWYVMGTVDFVSTDPGEVAFTYFGTYVDATALYQTTVNGGGLYNNSGGGEMTSVQIYPSAGTMTGTFNLLKLVV